MKSKAIKSYNLPSDRDIEYTIDAKPYTLIVILTMIGFALSILNKSTIMGFVMILVGAFATIFLPKRILLEFCKDYVVLYNKANHYDCYLIYYYEIVSWTYIKKVHNDELLFELEDGSTQSIESFGPYKIEKLLDYYAPSKKKRGGKKK